MIKSIESESMRTQDAIDYYQVHHFYFLDSITNQDSELLADIPNDFHVLRHVNRSGPFPIGKKICSIWQHLCYHELALNPF